MTVKLMLSWMLLVLNCFGLEDSVEITRDMASDVDSKRRLLLGRGLMWTGEGNFTKFHLNHAEYIYSAKDEPCIFITNRPNFNSACWKVASIDYHITPAYPISKPSRCCKWKPCTVSSDEAMLQKAISEVWTPSAEKNKDIPLKFSRLLPEMPPPSLEFSYPAPAGASRQLFIKFILLKLNMKVRLNSDHLVPSKPASHSTHLYFPLNLPTSIDALIGLTSKPQ
ncbi:hypothetical protein DSO57_1020067 [Entomophthora muscae]|uniref:Uncharacterized protein n=1 Tax=Entomophthora muscae TaxID=34485 RepID=A0ACC2TRE7_9FUNG|nr:hypothetical protein DSO57_1020067 [Entomophthora muscae]